MGDIVDLSRGVDLANRGNGGGAPEREGGIVQVPIAASAQKPDGQFTMLRASTDGYIMLSDPDVERIARRVVVLMRADAKKSLKAADAS